MFPKSLGHGMVAMGFDARPPGPGCPLSPLSTLLRTLAKMTPTTCFRPSLSSQLFRFLSRLIFFPKGNEKLLEFIRSETAGSYSWPHPHVGLLLSCLRNILKWWPFWRGQGQPLGGLPSADWDPTQFQMGCEGSSLTSMGQQDGEQVSLQNSRAHHLLTCESGEGAGGNSCLAGVGKVCCSVLRTECSGCGDQPDMLLPSSHRSREKQLVIPSTPW